MADADCEHLGVAVFATVHIPERASIRAWRRPGERIVVFAFGDERFELEMDDGVIPLFASALAKLPNDGGLLVWDHPADVRRHGAMRSSSQQESPRR